MKNLEERAKQIVRRSAGFSTAEMLIVFLVISIVVVLALPQIMSSRRLFRFAGLQRQVTATMRDARQQAMSQRVPITFRWDDSQKRMVVYGGIYGALGDSRNVVQQAAGEGLEASEIVYGRPTGAPTSALADGTNLTSLASNAVEVVFQNDGSVIDASGNPKNTALFFYSTKAPAATAFAVSVLGAGGRAKVWRYASGTNMYVE